ncbi:MAG TPA: hypothetical protein VH092_11190 [Urbifossiella sp.]|jgi:hypothetical protein|nr:hypothetical protein [Urbifossiella sp.]
MNRTLISLVGLLAAAAAARADLAVPPPAGKKFAKIEVVFTTEKSYPEFDFYVVVGSTPKKVEFGPDAPAKVDGNRRNGPLGVAKFVAVPKGAAETFPTEKAFTDALRTGKVTGQAGTKQTFYAQTTIDAKDPRNTVVETYAVEKVDAKDGIVLKAAKGTGTAPPKAGDKNAAEDENADPADEAAAPAPRGGVVIAGLAAALALAFAGLWLARRSRPH